MVAMPRSSAAPDLARRRAQPRSDPRGAAPGAAGARNWCWRSPAAPASTRCISPPACRISPGSRPTSIPRRCASIEAHRAVAQLPNLLAADRARRHRAALAGDARGRRRVDQHDPHRAVGGGGRTDGRRRTAAGARRVLYLYGPFKEDGRHTAPSNAAFDASLQARDPDMGRARHRRRVATLAGQHGFDLVERVAMPANNLSLVFRRRAT